MNHKYKKSSSGIIKKIALERVYRLFNLIEKKENYEYQNRYIQLAFKISMRYRVRIPSTYKHRICKHCNSYLFSNSSCRIRIKGKYKLVTCFSCGNCMHYPYK